MQLYMLAMCPDQEHDMLQLLVVMLVGLHHDRGKLCTARASQ